MVRRNSCVIFVTLFSVIWGGLFLPEFEKTLEYKYIPFVPDPLLNHTEFGPLLNHQLNAKNVNESTYPWMALMYRSKASMKPYSTSPQEQPYCSAICIQERIFMTSARCVYNQLIEFVWLFMDSTIFYAQAFVMPNLFSKQAFDDIGFVIVKRDTSFNNWKTVKIYSKNKRNNHNYAWFEKSDLNKPNGRFFKAIGFAQKMLPPSAATSVYLLFELDVVIDIQSCVEFHTKRHQTFYPHHDGFHVPCYYYCTLKEWRKTVSDCWTSLSPHGGAVYNPKTQEVIGVITWGGQKQLAQPPVGFAVPNSKIFYEDYKCAQAIRDDKKENVEKKYYQKLCDKKKTKEIFQFT